MKRQAYLDLKDRQRKEIEDFPIAYAFSEEQLKMALKKLGATKEECVSIFGHGDIVKKVDAPRFVAMLKRHDKEVREALVADKDFAVEAFLYEMDNHEYAINWSGDEDVLGCFGLEAEDLDKLDLRNQYLLARKRHMDHARKWDMI